MVIDTKKILHIISNQIADLVLKNQEYYKDLEIRIEEEQMFVGEKNGNYPNTVYIVVSFLPATIDFGQTSIPITFRVIAEQNNFERIRNLFNEYAYTYNLYWNEDKTMQQVYELPSVSSNFNEIYEGFRTLLTIPGAILLIENGNDCVVEYFPSIVVDEAEGIIYYNENGENLNSEKNPKLNKDAFLKSVKKHNSTQGDNIDLKSGSNFEFLYNGHSWKLIEKNSLKTIENVYIYDYGVSFDGDSDNNDKICFRLIDGYDELEFISLNTETSIALDTQAFYNNDGFTKSKGKFGSFSINLTTYLFDNDFLNKCLAVYLKDIETEPDGIDTIFNFKIKFKSGHSTIREFKIANFSLQQRKGELPMVSITFAE